MLKDIVIKVLLVDDEPNNLLSLSSILDFDDIKIITAENGEQALNLLLDNEFGLIISDIRMPGMDGFELLEYIRMDPINGNVPVILATAHKTEKEFVYKGYEEGAVDYLLKPLEPSITKSKARIFIDLAKQQKAITSQKNQLLQLLEQKNKLMGMIAHDIRGPLAAISSYSDLILAKQDIEEDTGKYTSNIKTTSANLLMLLEDLLDLNALESNELELNLIAVNLHALLDEILELNTVIAKKKEISIVLDNQIEGSRFIFDKVKVTQVFNNLISNSVKYSPLGTEVRIEARENDKDLIFSIIDQGLGIPEEEISKLFKMYQTTSVKGTLGEKSTGLGLYKVKSIVEAHGGEMCLESEVNKGSTFSFTISKDLKNDVEEEEVIQRPIREGVDR